MKLPNLVSISNESATVHIETHGKSGSIMNKQLKINFHTVLILQKWFAYEAHTLIPFISNGPLIFWMYPVFGIQGASWFLGVSEWAFGALLFLGFWNKQLGILGALGCCVSFIMTLTIIPFMPDGWAASAGGFPAMTGNVPFLMKDLVLFAASFYLLKQDVASIVLSQK